MDSLEALIHRATDLYTLPSVAVDVLTLTGRPDVDTRELKECIERDPALVIKILRVVNSSLFGLGSEVVDLNQALALLGTKPLKLLVLGFNLPEALFTGVASEQLARYWTMALTRAVAAREIAQSLWHYDGDDAFIAGLLEDLGILVLLKEMGGPYARMLDGVWREHTRLSPVERASLGFDHRVLTTALLAHWRLPQTLVDAIAVPRDRTKLVKMNEPHAQLARILHLASLLAELVGRHRLCVLPDLLDAGKTYVHLSRERLEEIVEQLEPKVRALADVLSLHLPDEIDFIDVTLQAHRQMAAVAEEASGPLARIERCKQQLGEDVLAEAKELAEASAEFLANDARPSDRRFHAPSGPRADDENAERKQLVKDVESAVASARTQRRELSLLLLRSVGENDAEPGGIVSESEPRSAMTEACRQLQAEGGIPATSQHGRPAILLPGHDRHEAIRSARNVLRQTVALSAGSATDDEPTPLCIGIASVAVVSKNFDAQHMIDAAKRCLYAASQSGAGSVKSIELY